MSSNAKNILLSKRLGAVAGLVKSSACVCDIGTDHGFVPIYLINSNVCEHAIAMDINKGPLERAEEHIREYGLEGRIETRLSNGMEKLEKGDATTIICAGMGGLLMKRILEDGCPREKGVERMILQPQSDLRLFREYLRIQRFFIEDEAEIFEDGKYYVAMSVRVSEDDSNSLYEKAVTKICESSGVVSEAHNLEKSHKSAGADKAAGTLITRDQAMRICDRFGPSLILKRDETLRRYLEHEQEILRGILLKLSENEHTGRINDIMDKINDITIVLNMYD
ncbi:class I SAM-dependent methyltransferase [Butyrivibrio sp. JL13D10]|uniref:class I SAM-dependent methyltransferase n=1 Tax=Butyrivibrio sp. JL13D10 TaxID=3236815 RepID=UPI0038B64267